MYYMPSCFPEAAVSGRWLTVVEEKVKWKFDKRAVNGAGIWQENSDRWPLLGGGYGNGSVAVYHVKAK